MLTDQEQYQLSLDPSGAGARLFYEDDETEEDVIAFQKDQVPPVVELPEQKISADAMLVAVGAKAIVFLRAFIVHWGSLYGASSIRLAGSCLLAQTPLKVELKTEQNIANSLIYVLARQSSIPCSETSATIIIVLAGQAVSNTRGCAKIL
jgi:hypothetical protein